MGLKKLLTVLICFLFILFPSTVLAATRGVSYSAYVESIGLKTPAVNGATAGTTGKGLKVEAIKVDLNGYGSDSGVTYQVSLNNKGWTDPVSKGNLSGTTDGKHFVEALKIKLTGTLSDKYDIYYRTHLSSKGWLGWAKNEEISGSTGFNRPVEAFQVRLVKKGDPAPGPTGNASMIKKELALLKENAGIRFKTYYKDSGWDKFSYNGEASGNKDNTEGFSAFYIELFNLTGNISSSVYLNGSGWQDYVNPPDYSGTTDENKFIEAIAIKLSGDTAKQFDIGYRVHVKEKGWLDWAYNGEKAGSRGLDAPITAIEVRLQQKELKKPGSSALEFIDNYSLGKVRKSPVPGEATIKNLLLTALEPVGKTLYIYGGGWANSKGNTGNYIGFYPGWLEFYKKQDASYNYENHQYDSLSGLDCAGYIGWTVYNTLNTQSGGDMVSFSADELANIYSDMGYGDYQDIGQLSLIRPGDIVSLHKDPHTYIALGTCKDGSVLLLHSSPPGVMISGTTPKKGTQTQATKLSHDYMKRYFPDYYRKYYDQLDRENDPYLTEISKMSFNEKTLKDPDNLRSKSPQEVLSILFNE